LAAALASMRQERGSDADRSKQARGAAGKVMLDPLSSDRPWAVSKLRFPPRSCDVRTSVHSDPSLTASTRCIRIDCCLL
jgi:hypothetical protein